MNKPTNNLMKDLQGSMKRSLGEASQQQDSISSVPAPFPVEVFPEPVRKIIMDLERTANYPIDYTAAGILFAISVAMGTTYKLKQSDTWEEYARIYIALVGLPGSNKSHPLSFALTPIFDHDQLKYKAYKRDLQEWEQAEADKGLKPTLRKMLVSDATIEALVKVHEENTHGLGLYADELAAWFANFNKYSKGSDQEFWLSNWSGKPIITDRKTQEPSRIDNPFISVAGTIQPGRLEALGANGRNQNGFIDRILFVYPHTSRKVWPEQSSYSESKQEWKKILTLIIEETTKTEQAGEIITLPIDKGAFSIIKAWQVGNVKAWKQADEESLQGVLAKLENYVLRLCMILQILRWATDGQTRYAVEEETARKAVTLIQYFAEHGQRVNNLITGWSPVEALTGKRKVVYERLPTQFQTGEGVQIAERCGMKERTFKKFIRDRRLFNKEDHGQYRKEYE